MLPKVSLIEELRRGGYEASVIATYNAYLPFFEEVVLRRLQNAGVRNNVLLMDAKQYGASVQTHPPRLAGRHYTLLPVRVGAAFHPKLILLVGKHKATVLVGSHNLTLAGFGFNRELTNMITAKDEQDQHGREVARTIWREVQYWVDHYVDVPGGAKDVIHRIAESAPWLQGQAVPNEGPKVLAGRPGSVPLWDQLKREVGGAITSVTVAGAFFDADLAFLQQLVKDYKQAKITVAVEPGTVALPLKAKTLKGVSFVRAGNLGEEGGTGGSHRYLHAKCILLRGKAGVGVLAVGSANPSAPAWLRGDAGANVELMVVHSGKTALAAADSLGYAALDKQLPLQASDWQQIRGNSEDRHSEEPLSCRYGVAVVDDDRIAVESRLLIGLDVKQARVQLTDGSQVTVANLPVLSSGHAVLSVKPTPTRDIAFVDFLGAKKLLARCLVHHPRDVEEHSRTGTQRRFREALQSLHTASPNIELLIQCIDRIVFTSEGTGEVHRRPQSKAAVDSIEEPSTLAIDVEDLKKRSRKKRLRHTSDFGYLLDTLIYHLRIQDDRAVDEQDLFGRNEEEQVGKDDDEKKEKPRITVEEQAALLSLCHRKVTTVIRRMNSQMESYRDGKELLSNVLVRLLAVLAVMRELRACDGRVAWVQKGQTAVPEDGRRELLEAIVFNLFERNAKDKGSSMLNLEPLGEEFHSSDDVARLKGLILWLGWECGLTFDAQKPFNEDREDREERLRVNAMVLALAQMIQSDEVVIDEARQSIGSLTSGELNWLDEIRMLANACSEKSDDPNCLGSAEAAEPGDIVVHRSLKQWGLRLVASNDGSRVFLIRLDSVDETLGYKPDHLAVIKPTAVASPID